MELNYKERVEYFHSVLTSKNDHSKWTSTIDMKAFRDACFYGVPDEPGLRSISWKLLLDCLPPNKSIWTSTLRAQRLFYYNSVIGLLKEPGEEPQSIDHPLNDERGSKWASYFEDNSILEQIDKDVKRTLPDFAFFHLHVPINRLNPLSPHKQQKKEQYDFGTDPLSVSIPEKHEPKTGRFSFGLKEKSSAPTKSNPLGTSGPRNLACRLSSAFVKTNSGPSTQPSEEPICPFVPSRRSLFQRMAGSDPSPEVQDYHWEVIERILFIYAKLNPDVSYVQGMNELLAPIYYVFAKLDDIESQAYAEADAFHAFTALMSDVRDHFVGSLDLDSNIGINATLGRLSQRLSWFDNELFLNLNQKDVKEQYYAFRWITVLCSQEWDLPDLIRLWDSILASRGMQEGRFEFLLDFTVAMLVCIRQELMMGDFADNMHILQNYPIGDVQIVINTAYAIRKARLNVENTVLGDPLLSISSLQFNKPKVFEDKSEKLGETFDQLPVKNSTRTDHTRKRISTGEIAQNMSQRLGLTTNRVKRASSVRSSSEEDEFKRNWSFASPSNEPESEVNRSLFSRLSQLVTNDPLIPYRELEDKSRTKYQIDQPAKNFNDNSKAYKSLGLS